MEKPITRINLLAKRIGLSKVEIAMCIIYIVTQDKVLAWGQTKGYKSKSKDFSSMAQQALNKPNIKKFIKAMGGCLGVNMALYLSTRGLPNGDLKQLNNILEVCLVDPTTDSYRLDKINELLAYAVDNGLTTIFRDEGIERNRTVGGVANVKSTLNENLIELRPEMSHEEYLLYLIQEQRLTPTQKEKNAFTLKISDYMAFKNDKTNELRPTIYLCNREHKSTLQRLASLAKGSFNK